MPRDISAGLIESLRALGDDFGPLGVALAAATLTDVAALRHRLDENFPSRTSAPATSADLTREHAREQIARAIAEAQTIQWPNLGAPGGHK